MKSIGITLKISLLLDRLRKEKITVVLTRAWLSFLMTAHFTIFLQLWYQPSESHSYEKRRNNADFLIWHTKRSCHDWCHCTKWKKRHSEIYATYFVLAIYMFDICYHIFVALWKTYPLQGCRKIVKIYYLNRQNATEVLHVYRRKDELCWGPCTVKAIHTGLGMQIFKNWLPMRSVLVWMTFHSYCRSPWDIKWSLSQVHMMFHMLCSCWILQSARFCTLFSICFHVGSSMSRHYSGW